MISRCKNKARYCYYEKNNKYYHSPQGQPVFFESSPRLGEAGYFFRHSLMQVVHFVIFYSHINNKNMSFPQSFERESISFCITWIPVFTGMTHRRSIQYRQLSCITIVSLDPQPYIKGLKEMFLSTPILLR